MIPSNVLRRFRERNRVARDNREFVSVTKMLSKIYTKIIPTMTSTIAAKPETFRRRKVDYRTYVRLKFSIAQAAFTAS